jgi:hypothetical protein
MRKVCCIIFISLLTNFATAGDLARSFEDASASALALDKDSTAHAYGTRTLMPYYQQKYSSVFQSCLRTTEHRDTSSFAFVLALGQDGRVLRIYTDHETNIFACARQTLEKDEFPHPPVSPFYMRVTMNFDNSEAGDVSLNSSFQQVAAFADTQEEDPATQEYAQRDLKPYYQRKYGPIFSSCLASTDHPDKSPFSFVAAIGKDGRVLHLFVDHETNIFDCVRRTLEKDEFPHPPVAPYYMHMSMSFAE